MGLFLYGASAGLTWVNLSALSGASGAADYDPNSQASSISSSSTGTTIAVQNSVSVDGWREGATWDLGAMSDIFGSAWAIDGTKGLLIRGTIVTSAPNSKKYWQALSIITSATYATADGMGPVYKRTATADQGGYVGNTGDLLCGNATTYVRAVLLSENLGISSGFIMSISADTTTTQAQQTVDFSAARLVISAGCEDNTNDGPHSAKVLWEAAVIDWSS